MSHSKLFFKPNAFQEVNWASRKRYRNQDGGIWKDASTLSVTEGEAKERKVNLETFASFLCGTLQEKLNALSLGSGYCNGMPFAVSLLIYGSARHETSLKGSDIDVLVFINWDGDGERAGADFSEDLHEKLEDIYEKAFCPTVVACQGKSFGEFSYDVRDPKNHDPCVKAKAVEKRTGLEFDFLLAVKEPGTNYQVINLDAGEYKLVDSYNHAAVRRMAAYGSSHEGLQQFILYAKRYFKAEWNGKHAKNLKFASCLVERFALELARCMEAGDWSLQKSFHELFALFLRSIKEVVEGGNSVGPLGFDQRVDLLADIRSQVQIEFLDFLNRGLEQFSSQLTPSSDFQSPLSSNFDQAPPAQDAHNNIDLKSVNKSVKVICLARDGGIGASVIQERGVRTCLSCYFHQRDCVCSFRKDYWFGPDTDLSDYSDIFSISIPCYGKLGDNFNDYFGIFSFSNSLRDLNVDYSKRCELMLFFIMEILEEAEGEAASAQPVAASSSASSSLPSSSRCLSMPEGIRVSCKNNIRPFLKKHENITLANGNMDGILRDTNWFIIEHSNTCMDLENIVKKYKVVCWGVVKDMNSKVKIKMMKFFNNMRNELSEKKFFQN